MYFKTLFTSKFLVVIWWLGVVFIALMGLAGSFAGGPILGLLGVVLVIALWRIVCEVIYVTFGIHDRLVRLVELKEKELGNEPKRIEKR